MRPLLCFCMILLFSAGCAHAQACGDQPTHPRWRVDHYVYDASLKRDWAVLADCEHPGAPARMELLPKGRREPAVGTAHNRQLLKPVNPQTHAVAVKAGASVEVSSAPDAPARILLAGTAMQTAFAGQPIRVRINASGRFVRGIALGPHSVELAASVRPSWSTPWRKP